MESTLLFDLLKREVEVAILPSSVTSGNFEMCSRLSKITAPGFTILYPGQFAYDTALMYISANDFPNVSYLSFTYNGLTTPFGGCSNLISVNFPSCLTIGSNCFQQKSFLTTAIFPVCSYINSSCFQECSALTHVELPNLQYVASSAFAYCRTLPSLSFNYVSDIYQSAFWYCSALSQLYLLSTSVVSLLNSNAFTYTPMQYSSYLGYFGSIYVLPSLVEAYKTATNWSYYSERITSYVEPTE